MADLSDRRLPDQKLLDHDVREGQVFGTGPKPLFLHPDMWLWEVLSVGFAILLLAALVVVLAVYDGKPGPLVGGITLNTVVAFVSTLFRMALMIPVTACLCQATWNTFVQGYRLLYYMARYDSASRGPLGSLQLLFSNKSRCVPVSPSTSDSRWPYVSS